MIDRQKLAMSAVLYVVRFCYNVCSGYIRGMRNPLTLLTLSACFAFPAFARAQATPTPPEMDTVSRVFTKVEVESEFPGGIQAWIKFLNSHLVYPKEAIRKKIEGRVMLQFIVDKDGTITNVLALSGDPLLQQAALDALAQSPKWTPAKQDGKPVKSYKKQPITFHL